MLLKSILALAATLTLSSAFAAEPAVSFQDAPKFYKQTKTVEGTIAATMCTEKMCFLNFDKDYKKFLSAVIMAPDFAKFSKMTGKELQAEMEKMYVGKKVQITGAITEYKGKEPTQPGRPQIALTNAADIKVLGK